MTKNIGCVSEACWCWDGTRGGTQGPIIEMNPKYRSSKNI